jgi:hypothetical protein
MCGLTAEAQNQRNRIKPITTAQIQIDNANCSMLEMIFHMWAALISGVKVLIYLGNRYLILSRPCWRGMDDRLMRG